MWFAANLPSATATMTRSNLHSLRFVMLSNITVAVAILAGCGGGGGDAPNEIASTPTQQNVAQLAASAPPDVVLDNNESLAPSAQDALMSTTAWSTSAFQPVATTAADAAQESAPDVVALSARSESGAVSSIDVAVQARPSQTFASQQWGNVQCNGVITQSEKTPESGIQGSKLVGGKTLRFGSVTGLEVGTGAAYEFTLNPTDAITAGSNRCEIAFGADSTKGLPRDATFWHGFSIKIPDWRSTTDEQALTQWHAGDSSGLLPIYTLLVRGKVMRLVLRYDSATAPSRTTTTTLVVWSISNWQPNTWLNFVTQARASISRKDNPYVKTWLNGTQIVNYSGPVGYYQPSAQPYVKHGIYHWVDSTNLWDMSLPTRTVHIKRPLLVRDPSGLYDRAKIEALVNTN